MGFLDPNKHIKGCGLLYIIMEFEIKITKADSVISVICTSFELTIAEMCKMFAKEDGCHVKEAEKMLTSVNAVLENLGQGQEFMAWEIEDHDKNNELVTCVISRKT